MKTSYCLAALLAVAAAGLQAKETVTPSLLKVNSIEVRHDDDRLSLTFDVDPQKVKPGSDRKVVFTPVVRAAAPQLKDSVVLEPMTIAGRNRYYTMMRNGLIAQGDPIFQAGKKGNISYLQSVEWQDWMSDSYIYMREETQDCCRPVKPLTDTPLASISTVKRKMMENPGQVDYVALTGDESVELEAQGSAFVDFIVNRTEIRDNYRKNPRELKKIIESIDKVKNDPDATITRLTIKGYASPEGSYDNNVRLAMGRTESLKEYVRKMYNFDPELMMTGYEPEDWAGLRRWLETATIPHRDEILSLVDSDMAPDPKDAEIKRRFPKEYKLMLDSVYPGLRHSDYTIRYKIRTFVDIDELKRVYAAAPERLRPVDFYRIAETYPKGSEEFEEVLLKASEVYPHDEQAAVNAANIYLRRGNLEAAAERASHAGESAEAYYTRGMLAALHDDADRAAYFFGKAKEKGMAEATKRLEDIEKSRKREIVSYLIGTDF